MVSTAGKSLHRRFPCHIHATAEDKGLAEQAEGLATTREAKQHIHLIIKSLASRAKVANQNPEHSTEEEVIPQRPQLTLWLSYCMEAPVFLLAFTRYWSAHWRAEPGVAIAQAAI